MARTILLGWIVLRLVLPSAIFAQTEQATPSAIIVTPTFQEIVITASDSAKQGSVVVSNQTDQQQTFEIFAVAIDQVDSQGNITLSDKPLSGTNDPFLADVEILEPQVIIAPKQQQVIPFTVKNSVGLSPGGHYVSLLIRAKSELVEQSATQSVLPAIASLLLIRKTGGEQYNLFLRALRFPHQGLWWSLPEVATLTFENQGNIHTIPRGEVKITDLFGRVVSEGTINEGSQFVLPRTQRELRVPLRQIRSSVPLMIYRISAQGTTTLGNANYELTAFSGYLSLVVIGVSLLFTLLSLSVYIWHKQKRRAK